MYTEFYGLREKPFSLSPDPRFLYLSEPHREALAHLLYGVEQGEGFIAITGEVGTGKTTLCRTLVRRLGPDVEVAFLFNPSLTARELLESIHSELGIEGRGQGVRELVDQLNQYLLAKRSQSKRVLLVLDEAQGLAPETLEQIRLLSNLETESDKLIQILMLGQPELDDMLESRSLRQLRQRIGVRWKLAPLSARETRAYVRHRLRSAAQGDCDLFTPKALREVHRRSRGVPRLVNLLCDRALLAGYAEGAQQITARQVRRADQELQAGSAARSLGRGRLRRWLAAFAVLLLAVGLGAGAWQLRDRLPELVRPVLPHLARLRSEPAPAGADVGAALGSRERAAAPAARPSVPAAPPVRDASSRPAEAATAVPPDLPLALSRRAPGETAASALHALLDAWSLEVDGPARPLSFPRMMGELSARGLGILTFPRTDLATLRLLDYPAVIPVNAADGVPRVVALTRLDGEGAELAGVDPERRVRVDASELERSWQGEAYVVWRDFEPLPELLAEGARGEAVAWIQRSLGELGFYASPASGRFDASTRRAVRAFQTERSLTPDGLVGPLTKMALYDSLARYAVPRLSSSGATG